MFDCFLYIIQNMTKTIPKITKFMPITKSILFELHHTLRVYTVYVNENELKVNLIRDLDREKKSLELASRFEILWQDLDESGSLDGVSEMYFLTGKQAGFTDTRIIYIWLKSWKMFYPNNLFYLMNTEFVVPFDFLDSVVQATTLNQAKLDQNDGQIRYQSEPKISLKK